MRASAAHIALSQPFHVQAELTRSLRYTGPPPTIVRDAGVPSVTTTKGAVSADDQLWTAREDPTLALRGIPLIGAGPGAMRGTRPESCLDKLHRLQVLWSLAASGATA